MPRDEFAVHHKVGPRGADIGRGAFALAAAAEQLDLDGHRKVLVFSMLFGRLAVDHHAAVAERPARAAGHLLAHKPVLDPQDVVGELVLVEQVAELAVEFVVLVVGDFQHAVLDAKRVAEVVAQLIALDLRRPAGQVLAVEQGHPLAVGRPSSAAPASAVNAAKNTACSPIAIAFIVVRLSLESGNQNPKRPSATDRLRL